MIESGFWQSIALVIVGVACLVVAAKIPATASALLPVGGAALAAADLKRIRRGPPPPAIPPPAPTGS